MKSLSVRRYLPQMWLNHKRRTTDGWNISNALTDMSGGFFSLAQQILDAYALQVGFSAHPGDLCSCLNSLVSSDFTILPWTQLVFFDLTSQRPGMLFERIMLVSTQATPSRVARPLDFDQILDQSTYSEISSGLRPRIASSGLGQLKIPRGTP